MFQLVNTSWLWALAAVGIPLLIHLWNIRQGKVLKVGSVSLLTAASKTSSRSFKLTDILLLIIRCLLLVLIALLLAWPVWQKQVQAAKAKGWILMPKEILVDTYHQFKPQIDSLQKAGYELHAFNTGFSVIDSLQLNKALQGGKGVSTPGNSNYWALLSRLNSRISASTPAYLYTTQQLRYFSGEKPATALNLHWQTYTPADSVSTWIASAWLTNEHNIRVIQGASHPAGTAYTTATIKSSPLASSPFKVETNKGKLTISLKEGNAPAVSVDTSTLRLAIYTDVNTTDAGYLKAALQTILQFNQHKAVIQQYTLASAIPASQDWLFWLSAQPLPGRLTRQAKHVFQYAPGNPTPINSWLNTEPEHHLAGNATDIPLYKSIPAKSPAGKPVWTDGFGRPILSAQPQGGRQLYRFYSRFNPAWSELVWNSRFPQILFKLLEPASAPNPVHDRRNIARDQLLPLKGESAYTASPQLSSETDLRFACWLAIAVLFLLERWLSHQTKTSTTNG